MEVVLLESEISSCAILVSELHASFEALLFGVDVGLPGRFAGVGPLALVDCSVEVTGHINLGDVSSSGGCQEVDGRLLCALLAVSEPGELSLSLAPAGTVVGIGVITARGHGGDSEKRCSCESVHELSLKTEV